MATKANLDVDQGTTFSVELNIYDDIGDVLNLTGYTINSQMRKWYSSINAAATFTSFVNVSSGVITLSLTANQTGNIVAGRYVYDVEAVSPELTKSRLVEGIVTVKPRVTR